MKTFDDQWQTDRDQRVPATLVVHRFEAMKSGQPVRDFQSRPQAAIIG
jgi:hypothetical protein